MKINILFTRWNKIILCFFCLLNHKVFCQDTLREKCFIAINGYYFIVNESVKNRKEINFPEGNVYPFSDTSIDLLQYGLFITKRIPNKLHKLRSEYYARIENNYSDTIAHTNLHNEGMVRNYILKMHSLKKTKTYYCFYNTKKLIINFDFYTAYISYVIVDSKNVSYITENGLTQKKMNLIKILELNNISAWP
jgi:hypothetical protein